MNLKLLPDEGMVTAMKNFKQLERMLGAACDGAVLAAAVGQDACDEWAERCQGNPQLAGFALFGFMLGWEAHKRRQM